jgi:hypothetical protein
MSRMGLALLGASLLACGGSGSQNPFKPTDIVIAGGPPIELAGLALWLDGDFGVTDASGPVRTWIDRSGHGHVFERESLAEPGATGDRLRDHGAVRLDGRTRLVLARTADEKARAALTVGDRDFLIAAVVQAQAPPVARPAVLLALSPFIEPDTAIPLVPFAALELGPEPSSGAHQVAFTIGGPLQANRAAADVGADAALRLVMIGSTGPAVEVRDLLSLPDGLVRETLTRATLGRLNEERAGSPPITLPFLATYVGGWDFDFPGLAGLVAEVVMVIGPDAAAAREPLLAYLRQKYRF